MWQINWHKAACWAGDRYHVHKNLDLELAAGIGPASIISLGGFVVMNPQRKELFPLNEKRANHERKENKYSF